MQMRNGSFRKYTPNHYELGYLLVAYGRQRFGDSVWSRIGSEAAAYHSILYPFQHAFKKSVSISFDQFVKDAMQYFHTQWTPQKKEPIEWISPLKPHDVVDYRYPF